MFSNLKVRTCIGLVLGLFFFAMLAATGAGWFATSSSNQKLEDVNGAYSNLVTPAYASYVSMLRARLNLTQSMLELQDGRMRESTAALDQAVERLGHAKRQFDLYRQAAQSGQGAELSRQVESAFGNYARTADRQAGALRNQDIRQFVELNAEMQRLNGAFDQAMDAYLGYIDTATDALVVQARGDYGISRGVSVALLCLAVLLCVGCALFIGRSVLRPLREAGQHFDRIAGGDLTARVEVRNSNEIGQLFASLKRMQESLTRTVSAVRRGVEEINVGAREISAGNTDLSSRTEQQAASLEETAASMEELASTVKQNADNARQANQLAASASDVAERGGAAVSEVVSTMEGISASSRKISEIVSVIDGIAFQTNILALNAAVEAARAGEQGKGFAVVAGEVRSLAQRSAQAAKEIKQLIEDSVSKVGTGSQQVERAGATMQEIVASVKRVTDIMGEISAASEEQSSGIDQVNRAVSQMDEVTQQNAALVEEAAAAAGSLQEQAQRLAEAVSVFKINAGEVIEVPAQALSHRSATPLVGQQAAPAQAAAEPAQPAPQQASSPAAPARLPSGRPAARAEGATAQRPARRSAAAGAGPAAPAPAPASAAAAATRRKPAAADDWESF
ncbi:methyl-accepting chemotaxis protein [Bordetella sp. 2513F-2]